MNFFKNAILFCFVHQEDVVILIIINVLLTNYLFTVISHLSPRFSSELSVNTAQFAKSAAMLGNSEDHTALSRALSQLAEVEEKIDQLHQEQANADFYLFSELLGDYVRLITAVKVRPARSMDPLESER